MKDIIDLMKDERGGGGGGGVGGGGFCGGVGLVFLLL